jgi:glycosyltransferase involved in cell wall biosynthesis
VLRVVFIAEDYPPDDGGIAHSAARLSAALASRVVMDVVRFARGEAGVAESWTEERLSAALTIHTCAPFVNGWVAPDAELRALVLERTAQRIAERLGSGVDLVHGFGLQNAGLVAARVASLCSKPLIQSIRGNDVGRNSFDGGRRSALYAALRRAAVVTAVNRWLADLVELQWPDIADRLRIIPNCVRIEPLAPANDIRLARAAAGLPVEAPLIGTVGTLREKKGPHVFEAVIAHSLKPRGGRLLVIGNIDLKHFHALGWTASPGSHATTCVRATDSQTVRHWLTLCDFCLFPSMDDGMANGLLEAMERARAVVASSVFQDVVVSHRDGLIVSPLYPMDFVQAADWLCEDAAARQLLGAAARRRVSTAFDASTESEHWLEAYDRCLGAKA